MISAPSIEKISPPLDEQTARATEAFMRQIRDRFTVNEAFLFGSRAQQTHTSDSDADVAVVLKGSREKRFAMVQDMAGVAFDVLLETGVNVQALPLWEDDLKTYSNPALLKNILRGLRL
jgi:predicted nucleotidyltransferase